MVGPDDIERLRAGYEAFGRGDLDAVFDDIDPDVELHDRSDLPDAGSSRGLDSARVTFGGVSSEFDDYEIVPLSFTQTGEYIVVEVRQSGRGKLSGVSVEETLYHVWEIRRDKAVGMRAFTTREDAFAAAGHGN